MSDFGLAKLRPLNDPEAGEYQPYVMTGETGSYRFMAPEGFKHQAYGRPVDVYSFSLILHYMLAGVAPWPHLDGMRAVEAAALEDERPAVPRSCAARAPEPRPRRRSRACRRPSARWQPRPVPPRGADGAAGRSPDLP